MLKWELYKEIARNLGDLVLESNPSSASVNSIVCSDLIYPQANQLAGNQVFIGTGAAAGQARVVASYNVGSMALYVTPAFGSLPSTNSAFMVFQSFKDRDYRGVIDRAFGIAKNLYYESYYTTVTLVATQYEYTVPSGMDAVTYLQLVPTSGSDYSSASEIQNQFELKPPIWRLEKNTIIFDPRHVTMTDLDKTLCRVYGQSRPTSMPTDNSTVPSMLEEYLIDRGSQLLAVRNMGRDNSDNKEWTSKYGMWRDNADKLEKYIVTQMRGELCR